MQLEIALHKLHQEINAEELLFWGKITGKSLSRPHPLQASKMITLSP